MRILAVLITLLILFGCAGTSNQKEPSQVMVNGIFSSYKVNRGTNDMAGSSGYQAFISKNGGDTWSLVDKSRIGEKGVESVFIDNAKEELTLGARGLQFANAKGGYKCNKALHVLGDGTWTKGVGYDVCASDFLKRQDGSGAMSALTGIAMLGLVHIDFVEVDSDKLKSALNQANNNSSVTTALLRWHQEKNTAAINAFNRNQAEVDRQKIIAQKFVATKLNEGDLVCLNTPAKVNYIDGFAKITGQAEKDNGTRIQVRIGGIEFSGSTTNYANGSKAEFTDNRGITFIKGNLVWVDKQDWRNCP